MNQKNQTLTIYFPLLTLGCVVKVLLKQPLTGDFVNDAGRWTANAAEALDFKTTPAAMDYARIHCYEGLSIVLKSTNSGYDVELPNCC